MPKKRSNNNNINNTTAFPPTPPHHSVEELNNLIEELVTVPNKAKFVDLPLSHETLRGLQETNFEKTTEVQSATLEHSLRNKDLLATARTGSGKTLAYLVPVLEKLYRSEHAEGVGAIVLLPTRELATQVFEVLRSIGRFHSYSAALVTGGKQQFHTEQVFLCNTHIIIATPGRLLQHLEQTPQFDYACETVQVLVLDEADLILEMGFRQQLERILDCLKNNDKQTLLFSATLSKSVKDLGVLALHKPKYVGVHDESLTTTPKKLLQNYVVCELQQKLDVLYSFIKSHLKKKCIVFLSSCSQVRYVYALMCALQPGVPLLALHGKIKQARRTHIYFDFLDKKAAVLFCTDVAARGLDFPDIDWVVQCDAPEDRDNYIHRVGRTARFTSGGRALLFLLPSEINGFMSLLDKGKIPIKRISINPNKAMSVQKRAGSIVVSNPEVNRLAKKAFASYLRSVYLMPNKDIFQVSKLPTEEFALSLGLASTPSLKFLQNLTARESLGKLKNKNRKLENLKRKIKEEKLAKRLKEYGEKAAEERNRKALSDNENDLLVIKHKHDWDNKRDDFAVDVEIHAVNNHKSKKIRVEGSSSTENKKIRFDEEGNEKSALLSEKVNYDRNESEDLAGANSEFMEKIRSRLEANREQDNEDEKVRLKAKREKQKTKINKERNAEVDREEEYTEGAVLFGDDSKSDQFESYHSSDSSVSSNSVDVSGNGLSIGTKVIDLKQQEEMALSVLNL